MSTKPTIKSLADLKMSPEEMQRFAEGARFLFGKSSIGSKSREIQSSALLRDGTYEEEVTEASDKEIKELKRKRAVAKKVLDSISE